MKEIDEKYMARALELAVLGRGFVHPNPMVGAVIVKDDKVIGEGYHQRCGEGHAEVNAFKNAVEDTTGATIYVTLEPCSHYGKTPPCVDLVIQKGIKRAVIATADPNPLVAGRGIEKMKAAGIDVTVGIMEKESLRLNEVFMKYIVKKEPFVLYKSAMTLDGRIATVTGASKWVSSEASREEVQKLRHQYSGIMVGIGTVLADDPMLTCRIEGGKNPIRIVVDSHLRTPLESQLLQTAVSVKTIIAATDISVRQNPDVVRQIEATGAKVLPVISKDEKVDLKALMVKLGEEGIDSILLEGGGTLAYSAFEEQVIDKVQFYIAPKIFGGSQAKTPVGGKGILDVDNAWALQFEDVRRVGEDLCIEAYRKGEGCLQEL